MHILSLWLKNKNECKKNSEKWSTAKLAEHIPSGHSVSTLWIVDGIENNHDVYRREDC